MEKTYNVELVLNSDQIKLIYTIFSTMIAMQIIELDANVSAILKALEQYLEPEDLLEFSFLINAANELSKDSAAYENLDNSIHEFSSELSDLAVKKITQVNDEIDNLIK